MKKHVVMLKNLPCKPPLNQSITMWLLLDRIHASGVWWGVFYATFSFLWVVYIVSIFTNNPVDLFEGKD